MYTIATLHQLRQRLGLAAGSDDARLLAALQAASAHIERLAGRRFTPRSAVLPHDVDARSPTGLLLDDDLLHLAALVDSEGPFDLESVLALPGGDLPASVLLLLDGEAFTWDSTPLQAVRVTGIWGWHDRWSQAWRNSGDTVRDNPLSAGAVTLTITNAEGADADQAAPRFQVGHLLKVEDEYLRVLAVTLVPDSDDLLTVERGANGTTAASHSQGTPIYTYQPPADVTALTLRWAAWLYREPDSRSAGSVPPAFLRELDPLRRLSVKA